ncbi:MAG: hypothetical protein ACKOA9_01255 [Actinomycetota bacterium]
MSSTARVARGLAGSGVHFLTATDPAEVAGWDPDREPERFADGPGHHLLEAYARLRERGCRVSLGPRPPRATATLVVSMDDLVSWRGHRRRRASWVVDLLALRIPRVLVVLGDHPHGDRVPRFVRATVVPNPSAVRGDGARWLPLLPQRGMIPRAATRRGRVATLALKTGTPNVPEAFRTAAFSAALADRGVTVRIDEHPAQWPDFADVDVVVCTHQRRPEWDGDDAFARKPPTKLINAWVAGCVPLVFPEVGYLDLAEPGRDALVVRSPAEVVEAVVRLRSDATLVAHLEAGVAARGAEFAMDRVLDRWEEELWGGDHAVTSRRAVARDAVGLVGTALGARLRVPEGEVRGPMPAPAVRSRVR